LGLDFEAPVLPWAELCGGWGVSDSADVATLKAGFPCSGFVGVVACGFFGVIPFGVFGSDRCVVAYSSDGVAFEARFGGEGGLVFAMGWCFSGHWISFLRLGTGAKGYSPRHFFSPWPRKALRPGEKKYKIEDAGVRPAQRTKGKLFCTPLAVP
jgi:hypothetical protein